MLIYSSLLLIKIFTQPTLTKQKMQFPLTFSSKTIGYQVNSAFTPREIRLDLAYLSVWRSSPMKINRINRVEAITHKLVAALYAVYFLCQATSEVLAEHARIRLVSTCTSCYHVSRYQCYQSSYTTQWTREAATDIDIQDTGDVVLHNMWSAHAIHRPHHGGIKLTLS